MTREQSLSGLGVVIEEYDKVEVVVVKVIIGDKVLIWDGKKFTPTVEVKQW